jgi:hypothetical protein
VGVIVGITVSVAVRVIVEVGNMIVGTGKVSVIATGMAVVAAIDGGVAVACDLAAFPTHRMINPRR